jgi:hypothetical protein
LIQPAPLLWRKGVPAKPKIPTAQLNLVPAKYRYRKNCWQHRGITLIMTLLSSLPSLSITTTAPLIDCHSLHCSMDIVIGLGLCLGWDWPEAVHKTGRPPEGRRKSRGGRRTGRAWRWWGWEQGWRRTPSFQGSSRGSRDKGMVATVHQKPSYV